MFAQTFDRGELTTKNAPASPFRASSALVDLQASDDALEHKSFRSAYCQSMNISEREFERHILKEAVYPHLKPFVMILGHSAQRLFGQDIELIRVLGATRSPIQFVHELNSFRSQNTFLREKCRCRASGRRLLKILINVWERT